MAKTRELIQEHTSFINLAEELPVYRIDANTLTQIEEMPTAADKAAALEAALTQEIAEDAGGYTYRKLGERLAELKKRKDSTDAAIAERLHELESITAETAKVKTEPERLNLTGNGEYALYSVLREYASTQDEAYVAECARKMVASLRAKGLLTPGWEHSKGERMRLEPSLLVESWNPEYAALGFDTDDPKPPFITAAVEKLANAEE